MKISAQGSKAVRRLIEDIKKKLAGFRTLIRKYGENVEVVDPQLKNNSELVEIL